MHRLHVISFALVSLLVQLSGQENLLASEVLPERIVVLVPGIVFEAKNGEEIRESQLNCWQGLNDCMKAFCDCRQHLVEFEGQKVSIQTVSDTKSGVGVYTILFSEEAAFDSITFRAIELHAALKEICRREQAPITLVGYSAGGLVSRIVVQEAIPGVFCPRQIDNVVTIATPHQGAALADNFAHKKTRFTSLQTTEPLIRKLNALSLPKSIHFTTFILSSFGLESGKPGLAYTLPEFDDAAQATIPKHFLHGGDGVVHNISQNLMLTTTGAKRISEMPVAMNTVLVRMPATDRKFSSTLHTTAFCSSQLCNKLCRSALRTAVAQDYQTWQAECLVQCHVEELIRSRTTLYMKLNQVSDVSVDEVTLKGSTIHYRATGNWVGAGPGCEKFSGEFPVQNNATFGMMEK